MLLWFQKQPSAFCLLLATYFVRPDSLIRFK
jgi:hypothetical protein